MTSVVLSSKVKLNRITTLIDLAKYSPKLKELHDKLDGRWEPDLTEQEFMEELLVNFHEDSYYFAYMSDRNELIYFIALVSKDPTKAIFWLFYMNPNFREETKNLLGELRVLIKRAGYQTVYAQTTQTTSSYERWIEKFGAQKDSIVYKFTL